MPKVVLKVHKLNIGSRVFGKPFSPYQHGYKRCTLCALWYAPPAPLRCTDCGKQLRTSSPSKHRRNNN